MSTDGPASTATPGDSAGRDGRRPHHHLDPRPPGAGRAAPPRGWATGSGAGNPPTISDVSSPESNGMSSETLLFTAVWDEDGAPVAHRLVARIEPPATDYPVFTTYDLGMQFRVMRLVGEQTEVPVPETFWYEPDPAVLGGPFFVMARVDGLVPPDVLPYTFGDNWVFDGSDADRHTMQESAIRAMAGIHALTPDGHDLSFLEHPTPGASSLERSLNHWRAYYQWVVKDSPSPAAGRLLRLAGRQLPDRGGRGRPVLG